MNVKSLGVAAAMVLPAAAPAEAAVDDERSVVVSLFAATVLSDAVRGLGQVNVAGSPPVKAERLSSVRGYSHEPVPAALPLFATVLGALGLLGWRRKRKAQAA